MKQSMATGFAAMALCAASPASAFDAVINFQGTVSSGIDHDGIFGAPGQSLAGKQFTVRVVIHPDGQYYFPDAPLLSLLATDRASLHYSIGGVGVGFTAPQGYGQTVLSGNNNYGASSSIHLASGFWDGPILTNVSADIFSPSGDAFSWNVLDPINYTTVAGDTSTFGASYAQGDDRAFSFRGDSNPLRVWTGGTSVVPEPATWAMMIAGFGLAGAGLRRARSQNVSAAAL